MNTNTITDWTARLIEVENKLNQGYIGGMTEYWQRCRTHILKQLLEQQLLAFNTPTNT